MFLVHTENNGLGKAVGFFQEIGKVPGDGLGAGAQGDAPLEISRGINFVGDFRP